MQHIDCPLCGSSADIPVAAVQDRLLGLDGQFTLVRCANCELHYLNPQPTRAELEHYYPAGYDPFETRSPDTLPLLQRLSVNYGLRKRCRAIVRYQQRGKLLEIGCANGLFMNMMRQMGDWQVQGVEISRTAVQYAREQLGLDVFHGELEEAGFAEHSFDAVVMWDVLEHLHRPKTTLHEIHRVLKPGGVFVFRVPVLDSWERSLFGPYWAGWDAPRHLVTFSLHTLGRMLEQTGFWIEQTACISGSYPAFVLSARFWARDHLSPSAQGLLRRLLESLPARLATSPLFYLLDQLQRSTVVTVVARPQTDNRHPAMTEDQE
jgi:SAM-dependent methyltransferase